jgi:hypothetical protein
MQLIQQLGRLAYSWFTFDLFSNFDLADSKSFYVDNECHYSPPEINEQCVLKHTTYHIQSDKPITLKVKPHKSCGGTATLIPSAELFALIIETNCQMFNNAEIVTKPYRPVRIPDCNLVKRRLRFRKPDSDYSVSYPEVTLKLGN